MTPQELIVATLVDCFGESSTHEIFSAIQGTIEIMQQGNYVGTLRRLSEAFDAAAEVAKEATSALGLNTNLGLNDSFQSILGQVSVCQLSLISKNMYTGCDHSC